MSLDDYNFSHYLTGLSDETLERRRHQIEHERAHREMIKDCPDFPAEMVPAADRTAD